MKFAVILLLVNSYMPYFLQAKLEKWQTRTTTSSLTELHNKKLSYCCDSRSYCMQYYNRLKQLLRDIYFNAVHCDRSVSTCE